MKTKIEPCEGCGMTAMDEYADPNLPELCVDCVDAMGEIEAAELIEINRQFAKEQKFRKRMMKLTKKELIERMINMKCFIDELVDEE